MTSLFGHDFRGGYNKELPALDKQITKFTHCARLMVLKDTLDSNISHCIPLNTPTTTPCWISHICFHP